MRCARATWHLNCLPGGAQPVPGCRAHAQFAKLVEELRKMGYSLRESELSKLQSELKALRQRLAAAERSTHVAADIRAAFERYDRNKSGRLDHRELRAALQEISGINISMKEAEHL